MIGVIAFACVVFIFDSYGKVWGPVAMWIKPNGPTWWRW